MPEKEKSKKKETIGAQALKLRQEAKSPYHDGDVTELQREILTKDYIHRLAECVGKAEKDTSLYFPYYILVMVSKEPKYMQNVIRSRFGYLQTPPVPNFDSILYIRRYGSPEPEFLWAVPNKEHVAYFYENPTEVHPDMKPAYEQVCKFASGELYTETMKDFQKECARMNGCGFPKPSNAATQNIVLD
ncbi:MAG: hypothetical protein OXF02_07255 [Simkaniaceae bacterium]|nr:hypothetical protein [Simkaniaceae bacterium]